MSKDINKKEFDIKNTNPNIYIKNIEGADIMKHLYTNSILYSKRTGTLPMSLQLLHLTTLDGFTIGCDRHNQKITDDVINVKFSKKYKSANLKYADAKKKLKKEKKTLEVNRELIKTKKTEKEKKYIIKKIDDGEKLITYYTNKIAELEPIIKEHRNTDLIESNLKKIEELKFRPNAQELQKPKSKSKEYFENRIIELQKVIDIELNKPLLPVEHQEQSCDTMRTWLYNNGFTITSIDKETGEVLSQVKYVEFQRSASKSRQSKVLYIKESLYNDMNEWCNMGLDFNRHDKKGFNIIKTNTETKEIIYQKHYEKAKFIKPKYILLPYNTIKKSKVSNKIVTTFKPFDLCAKLAYEALTGSAIEDTIVINPNNILLVDDITDFYKWDINLIQKNKDTSLLESVFVKDYICSSSLFDGESLIDTSIMGTNEDGTQHSFILLRSHYTKTASFNTNIQLFLQDHCPKDIEYDDWIITNKFCSIYAKDVRMIMCPTSLKILKYCDYFEMTEKEMFDYWKSKVEEDENIWGCCKHDKKSKCCDNENEIIQKSSYQMVGCLNFSETDVKELAQYELQYITKLKNNDIEYLKYLTKTSNKINANSMLVALAEHNPNIIHTEFFSDYRSKDIYKYIKQCKRGKLRNLGDYATLFGNGIEFLYHAIGQYDKATFVSPLVGNEVYTTLHDVDREYVAFRNPTTSPSNALVVTNKYVADIDKYFNLKNQVVCLNSVNNPCLETLSSADFDSDSAVIFDHPTWLKKAKETVNLYKPCINKVDGDKTFYTNNNTNKAIIDNRLAASQLYIQNCINNGALAMSYYWNAINNNEDAKKIESLLKKIDCATILSCVCIDLAKKMYSIDVSNEISRLVEDLPKEKPKHKYNIAKKQANINKDNLVFLDCPMDYLDKLLTNGISRAKEQVSRISVNSKDDSKNIDSYVLKKEAKSSRVIRVKREKILDSVKIMSEKMGGIYDYYASIKSLSEDDVADRFLELDNESKICKADIKKYKITNDVMTNVIHFTLKENALTDYKMNVLAKLYEYHEELFLKSFKKGK